MVSFICIRSLVAPIMAAAIGGASLMPKPALAEQGPGSLLSERANVQSPGTFQMLGTYTGIGGLLASVVGPGPTPGSQRLYASYIYYGNIFDILSIDPETGNTTVIHNPVAGESGVWGMTVGPDGNVYLGTLPNAHFLKLDTRLGTLADLGRPSSTESYIWSVTFGSDNRLYGATYPNCKLVRYDPATGKLEDLGKMDPAQEYARYVAASKDGMIYVGVGPAPANFAVYQIATGQHAEILPAAQQAVAFSKVFVGTDGNVYGSVNTVEYSLSPSAATPLGAKAAVSAVPDNVLSDGRTVSIGESLAASGSEALTLVVTDPTSKAKVEYPIAYQGEEMAIMRIGFGPGGALYGSTSIPANLFQVDMSHNTLDQIGVVGAGEVYSFLSHGNSLMIGAYSGLATLMSYQPGIPFSPAAAPVNPGLVNFRGEDDSWRPEAMIDGPDGNVYAGALAGYGFIQSPLIEWNPATGSVQLFDVVPNQSVVSLATWQNLILGGTSSSGGPGGHPIAANALLFAWNPSTQQVQFQIAPVAGARSITDLIAAPNGMIYGIAGNTLFEFNPQTQQVTDSQTLPFANVLYNSVAVDDAGRIWGLAESGIFAIDTNAFSATMIPSSPLQITGGFAMGNGNIYFVSGPSVYGYTIPLAPAAVTVSPAQTSVSLNTAFNVVATVTGAGAVPTGTVTLSGGGYTSPAETLAGGSYTFTIPANSLEAGTDTFTVSYNGDANYASTAQATSINVTRPAFTLTASTPAAVASGAPANSTITVTGVGNYAGTVTLACSLTSTSSTATDLPTCSATSSAVTLDSDAAIAKATFTVSAPGAAAALVRPGLDKREAWLAANGGAALALLIFVGIPARRRKWLSMVGVLAVMAALGSLTACGGTVIRGSSSKSPGNPANSQTTYTFTVTGTGNPAVNPTPAATFTLTVN